MTFRWRADDGPTLNAGLVALYIFRGSTSIAKKPYFVIFQGGSPEPLPRPPPSGSAHGLDSNNKYLRYGTHALKSTNEHFIIF